MPPRLLPASAAAFAPRASSVNVVLSSKIEPWLTATLKRINRIKRPINNNISQHLAEMLSSSTAIWTLGSIMLPKKPEERREDENPLIEALFNYQILHLNAYIVYVDMVLQNEVAFKLTPDSIKCLVEYHKEVHSVDISADTYSWSEKEMQIKKLHKEFLQNINNFVYCTHVSVLEGLEEDGAGELSSGKSDEVKKNIIGLFHPLVPPPPRVVDVVRPAPLLPASVPASTPIPEHVQTSPRGHPNSTVVLEHSQTPPRSYQTPPIAILDHVQIPSGRYQPPPKAIPDHIQTSSWEYQSPSYISNQSPLQSVEYSTPPNRFTQPQSHGNNDLDAYRTFPGTMNGTPNLQQDRNDKYDSYSPMTRNGDKGQSLIPQNRYNALYNFLPLVDVDSPPSDRALPPLSSGHRDKKTSSLPSMNPYGSYGPSQDIPNSQPYEIPRW